VIIIYSHTSLTSHQNSQKPIKPEDLKNQKHTKPNRLM